MTERHSNEIVERVARATKEIEMPILAAAILLIAFLSGAVAVENNPQGGDAGLGNTSAFDQALIVYAGMDGCDPITAAIIRWPGDFEYHLKRGGYELSDPRFRQLYRVMGRQQPDQWR